MKENKKNYECCIIGAGPAGLGAALELVRHGVTDILIIDKNVYVGGVARTEIYDGVRFDVGPHRFFTKNNEINTIWHEMLGKDFRPVSRLTRIFYKNRYFNYPVEAADVFRKLGVQESLSAALSFFSSQIHRHGDSASFEDWICQRFGRKLYEIFFKTYTEKVWGIPCSQISAEWAAQRIRGLDGLAVIVRALRGRRHTTIKTLVEEFDFPVLGSGQMYEAMRDEVLSRGATLMLDHTVIKLNRSDTRVVSVDIMEPDSRVVTITAQHFFSSIPMARFFTIFDPPEPEYIRKAAAMLRYRDHISVNLLVRRENVFPDQWIYVHSPEVQTARVANYNNFSKAMVPFAGMTALCAEYFVSRGQGLWNESDDSLRKLASSELSRMGLLKAEEIDKFWVVREAYAYPLYYIGFEAPYEVLKARINQFDNFYSIGRAGMHKYNNQDHSLMSGILAARNYLQLPGAPYVLWNINIDAEYLEEGRK
ncbi:MAG: NAD(P)-binding protein [Candidatus Omnitrophota bacterium]